MGNLICMPSYTNTKSRKEKKENKPMLVKEESHVFVIANEEDEEFMIEMSLGLF
jgi:hypothetical protein